MQPDDFDNFARVLDAAYSLHSKSLSADARSLFFAALGKYSLADVRKAFSAHISDPQRGQFPPKPADLIAHLQGDATKDGRPEAAEAWAMSRIGLDESKSVRWTREMAEAIEVARKVQGNEYAERTAFTSAYNRLVAEARAEGRRPEWSVSWGHDVAHREIVAIEAMQAGQLSLEHARAVVPQLEAPQSGYDRDQAERNIARLQQMAAAIPSATERMARTRAAEEANQRRLLDTMKADTQRRVDEYRGRP